MNSTKLAFLLATVLTAPAAVAQSLPDTASGPVDDLLAQVSELAARVQTLEDNAPTSSVEGRTYCFVLDLTMMHGIANNQTEALQTSIIRRTATFSGGTFTALPVSHLRNSQDDFGVVSLTDEFSPNPTVATYTQTGNKLDMVLPNPNNPNVPPLIANWYVSADGSLISGTTIGLRGPFPNSLTVGQVRHWTLVENDTCDADNT